MKGLQYVSVPFLSVCILLFPLEDRSSPGSVTGGVLNLKSLLSSGCTLTTSIEALSFAVTETMDLFLIV